MKLNLKEMIWTYLIVLDTENNREIFKGMFKEKVMETKNDFEIGD